jgi:hypothetical protein
MLEVRTVEPEEQPLLANDSETIVSRQRLGNHVPAATDTHATIGALLETVFYTRPVQKGYKEDNWDNGVIYVREAVKKMDSWKGAAVQRGLEPGRRGLAIVRSRYQAATSEDIAGWKAL